MPGTLNILVTRAEPDADTTAEKLASIGIASTTAPLMQMHALTAELPEPTSLSAIALTSANALRALEKTALITPYLNLPVFTVGDRTAAYAQATGFKTVTSANGSFTELVDLLNREEPHGAIFYPTTKDAAGDLSATLTNPKMQVVTRHVYKMQATSSLPAEVINAIKSNTINAASFYSRRAAETFCALTTELTPTIRQKLTMLCLSENIATPLIADGFARVALTDYPSEEAMMALAASLART